MNERSEWECRGKVNNLTKHSMEFLFFFFLAVLGLQLLCGLSLVALTEGYSLAVMRGLPVAVASPVKLQ